MQGEARPLDGVPTTVKDIATKGTPVPLGTAARPLDPAPHDAPPAARLREAGAIIMAKTTMPDYGMLSSGLSSFHPLTANPWDLTGRIPAAARPERLRRRLPGTGPFNRHRYRRIHPPSRRMVRDFRPEAQQRPHPDRSALLRPRRWSDDADRLDAALMMSVLSKPDPRDTMSLPFQDLPWGDLHIDVKGLRIGLMLEAGIGLDVEPRCSARCRMRLGPSRQLERSSNQFPHS